MSEQMGIEELIASAGASAQAGVVRAPSTLKSRIYSRLVQEQAAESPLLSLPETKAAGRPLCVFEELVRIAPVGEALKTKNCCRVCHARVIAERVERAPIYWPHCPYVLFQNR
jgi:hypothetical protein